MVRRREQQVSQITLEAHRSRGLGWVNTTINGGIMIDQHLLFLITLILKILAISLFFSLLP